MRSQRKLKKVEGGLVDVRKKNIRHRKILVKWNGER